MTWLRACCAWESLTLFALCVGDMWWTLFLVHHHLATEANPLMEHWLLHGDFAFCAIKTMSFLPFLFIAAYYRASRPRMIASALRATLILYVVIYSFSVAGQFYCG